MDNHIERLISALRHGCSSTRPAAARQLADMGKKAAPAVPAMIEQFQRDGNNDVRVVIADSLGKIGDMRALPALQESAAHDQSNRVKGAARTAVQNLMKSNLSTSKMLAEIKKERDPEIRASYLYALSQRVRDKEAIAAVFAALDNEADQMRQAAVSGLALAKPVGWDNSLAKLFDQEKVEEIRRAIADALTASQVSEFAVTGFSYILEHAEDPKDRANAIKKLGDMQITSAVPFLLTQLEIEEEIGPFVGIVHVLGLLGDESAAPALRRYDHDFDRKIRAAVAEALVLLTVSSMSVEELIQRWNEKATGPSARIRLLSALQDKGQTEVVISALADKSGAVRAGAGRVLAGAKIEAAVQPLLAQLQAEEKDDIRGKLLESLQELAPDQAANAQRAITLGKVNNEAWQVRLEAVETLAQYLDTDTATVLLGRLDVEEVEEVKDAIFMSLEANYGVFTPAKWVEYVDFDSPGAIPAAAEALLQLEGNLNRIEMELLDLIILLNSERDWRIRLFAARKLAEINNANAIDALKNRQTAEEDDEVIEVIEKALKRRK